MDDPHPASATYVAAVFGNPRRHYGAGQFAMGAALFTMTVQPWSCWLWSLPKIACC